MTYEEKLEKVICKLNEERELTRKGHSTQVTFDDRSFTRVRVGDVCKILLKLQDDEKIIRIVEALQPDDMLDPYDKVRDDNYEKVEVIIVELLDTYEKWYEDYLLKAKTNLGNLDYINMLRIYDVVLDINEQIQLTNKTDIYIHLIPSLIRFQALFPADTIGLRDQYCENRLGGLKYLKNKGAVDNYSYGSSGWSWDSNVEISLRLSAFDIFYKTIRNEYVKRNRASKEEEETPVKKERVTENIAVWPEDFKWEGKDFVFGQYGSIDFSSDDRKLIFKTLTDKKGGWATMSEMKGTKDTNYIRSTIKQIKDRLPKEVKKHLSIISTKDEDNTEKPKVGAYRIKLNS